MDYILIYHRFRNNVRCAQTIARWKANVKQELHNVIQMDITPELMKNCKTISHTETGDSSKYDIHEYKNRQGILETYSDYSISISVEQE